MSDLVGNPEDWFSHNEAHICHLPQVLGVGDALPSFLLKTGVMVVYSLTFCSDATYKSEKYSNDMKRIVSMSARGFLDQNIQNGHIITLGQKIRGQLLEINNIVNISLKSININNTDTVIFVGKM